MRLNYLAALIVFNAPRAISTHLQILIPSQGALSHPSTLPPSTHATLTTLHQTYSAPITTANYFDFRNVSAGSYLLDVHCHTHVFAPLRVDVNQGVVDKVEQVEGEGGEAQEVQVWGTWRGNEWSNKGEKVEVQEVEGRVGVWGFSVKATSAKEYFVERAGFSPMSILKNPMILIAGVSMILVFGLPYLMDNMDDEMKAEFEASQKRSATTTSSAPANPLQNFDAAAWLSGASKKSSEGVAVEKGITR